MHLASIFAAVAGVAASPIIWNIVARNEYRNHTIERTVKSKLVGCYLLAAWIFFSSLYRDYLFDVAMNLNAEYVLSNDESFVHLLGTAASLIFGAGMVLVLGAYYRLGITGTYLGDYFGILMKSRVTAFPFSHFENPMYLGSTMCFLAMALWSNSLVGVVLSGWVYAVYHVSTTYFEGPFTTMIYENAAKAKKNAPSRSK